MLLSAPGRVHPLSNPSEPPAPPPPPLQVASLKEELQTLTSANTGMAAEMTALKDRFELEMAAMQIQVATLTAAVARCAAVLTDDAGSKVDSLDGISRSDMRALLTAIAESLTLCILLLLFANAATATAAALPLFANTLKRSLGVHRPNRRTRVGCPENNRLPKTACLALSILVAVPCITVLHACSLESGLVSHRAVPGGGYVAAALGGVL